MNERTKVEHCWKNIVNIFSVSLQIWFKNRRARLRRQTKRRNISSSMSSDAPAGAPPPGAPPSSISGTGQKNSPPSTIASQSVPSISLKTSTSQDSQQACFSPSTSICSSALSSSCRPGPSNLPVHFANWRPTPQPVYYAYMMFYPYQHIVYSRSKDNTTTVSSHNHRGSICSVPRSNRRSTSSVQNGRHL